MNTIENVAVAGTKTAAIQHAIKWLRQGKVVAVLQNTHGVWFAVCFVGIPRGEVACSECGQPGFYLPATLGEDEVEG